MERDIWFHAPLATRANCCEVSRSDSEIKLAIDCYAEYVTDFRPSEIEWSQLFQNGRFSLQKYLDDLDSEGDPTDLPRHWQKFTCLSESSPVIHSDTLRNCQPSIGPNSQTLFDFHCAMNGEWQIGPFETGL
jgi:hypothetical protein